MRSPLKCIVRQHQRLLPITLKIIANTLLVAASENTHPHGAEGRRRRGNSSGLSTVTGAVEILQTDGAGGGRVLVRGRGYGLLALELLQQPLAGGLLPVPPVALPAMTVCHIHLTYCA